MTAHNYLSEDGMAIVLLCSAFGLDRKSLPDSPVPLTLSEWNELAPKISESSLQQPAGLLGQSADALSKALQTPASEAQRMAQLLERAGRLTLELENLFTAGMWVVT